MLLVQHLLRKKTKTQGQNSSKKIKNKTQPLGGTPLKFEKLKKITKFLFKKFWGGPKMQIFKTHIVKKEDIFDVCQ